MIEVTIYDREQNGERWKLISQGNGLFYTLRRIANGESFSVFFQGDDAEDFRRHVMDDNGWLIDKPERIFIEYDCVMTNDAERD